MNFLGNWLDMLFRGDSTGGSGEPTTMLLVLLMAFCAGHVIGWVYMWTHRGLSYSQSFTASLVVIPVVVAMIMTLMTQSLAVAFGLLAVFAVVRFRNVLKDTRDTTFILWSIVQGMAIGITRFSTALIGCICVALVYLYLRTTSYGGRHRYDVILSLHMVGDESLATQLKSVLRRHSARVQKASQRNLADEMLDLSYRLLLRDPSRSHELLTELEATEGIAHVSLYHREDESEM